MHPVSKKVRCTLLLMSVMLVISGCGTKATVNDEPDVIGEGVGEETDEAVASQDPVQTTEPVESREVKYQMDSEAMAELEDSLFDGVGLAAELEEIFAYDRSEWFETYNGEKLQRISGAGEVDESLGASVREDIIFYQAEEGEEPEDAVLKMIDAMISPLMESSDRRAYTILEYEIVEKQPMCKIGEGIWMLYYIDGYYRYEGADFVTMEQYIEGEPSLKLENGMMPFQRQGSDRVFLYLLLQEGDVYRLQRYDSMTHLISLAM